MQLSQVKITQDNINNAIRIIKKNCESCNEYKLYDICGRESIQVAVSMFCALLGIKAKIRVENSLFEEIIFTDDSGREIERIKIE